MPSRARAASIVAALVATAGLVAGCLPTTLRPTPSPSVAATPSASSAAPSAAPSPTLPTPTPAPTFLVHVVARGDTLLTIGRRYGTTGRSVAYWNRERYPSLDPDSPDYEPDAIAVGWELRLIPGQTFVPSDDESPPPVATPQPSLEIPPGPTPAAGTSVLVSNGARGGNAVALTFELGGRLAPMTAELEWLVEQRIPATILVTGSAAESGPGAAALELVAAHPDLFSVGLLGWSYADLTDLAPAAIAAELERTASLVEGATGRSATPFVRPPFGSHDAATRAAIGEAGWAFTVLWDVDPQDWRAPEDSGPTAVDIRGTVLSRAVGGSIVALHLGAANTLEALPGIVEGLRERELEPVTLHRLLGQG